MFVCIFFFCSWVNFFYLEFLKNKLVKNIVLIFMFIILDDSIN